MDLPNPGIEPGSPALQADSLPAELPGKPIAGMDDSYLTSVVRPVSCGLPITSISKDYF